MATPAVAASQPFADPSSNELPRVALPCLFQPLAFLLDEKEKTSNRADLTGIGGSAAG
jgi:hypothetical protein